MAIKIESHQNKIFKQIKGLSLKKNRDKEGLFVAEGLRFVSEIPLSWEIEMFVVTKTFAKDNGIKNFEKNSSIPLKGTPDTISNRFPCCFSFGSLLFPPFLILLFSRYQHPTCRNTHLSTGKLFSSCHIEVWLIV